MRHDARTAMHVLAATMTLAACATGAAAMDGTPRAQAMLGLGLRGVYFVPNQGQWGDGEVHFGLKSRGLDVAFRESSLTMHMTRENESTSRAGASTSRACAEAVLDIERDAPLADTRGSSGESADIQRLTLTITFPGSNDVEPVGARPQAAKFNYFVGGEGRGVAIDVPSFGAVIYENLYDGIDLHVMGSDDGVLKYEFHVAPGADYNQIRIHYDGIDSLCIDDNGDLHINTSFGILADAAPLVWQEGSSSRADASTSRAREEAVLDVERDAPLAHTRGSSSQSRDAIPARFELCDARTYRIALDGTVDPDRELIIDPEIEWMYYLGGSGSESGRSIAVDSAGNALMTGTTQSTDFEGRNNAFHGVDDAFVVKVSASGTLQWMTYLGGNAIDEGLGIAADSAGNAMVTGETYSTDFEGRNNAHHSGSDAFVVKVSASGALQWMTYLGGSGDDRGNGIAVDSAGNALVTGYTESTDFEGRNNAFRGGDGDAFVVKVSASGTRQWMTYLGGNLRDYGHAIAVDSAGNALVTGYTWSIDFVGRNNTLHGGQYDAFALKVSASGTLQRMTYLGGTSWDSGHGISVDSAGNALVTGNTYSSDFEGRNNARHGNSDAFAVKISASGALQWMTYLGGRGSDNGIALHGAGDALVTGYTDSTDFEGQNNAFHGGSYDAFVVKVSASGALEWMTYLGGSGWDFGYGIAVDSAGNALVAGYTWSTDFDGRNNAHHGGFKDAFVVELRIADELQLNVTATCPSGGPIQVSWSGATRAQLAALMFAVEQGAFVLPPQMPCAGTPLGLGRRQLQVVWTGNTGPDGSGSIDRFAGPNACGGYLQLLDLTTCSTSNVARIE